LHWARIPIGIFYKEYGTNVKTFPLITRPNKLKVDLEAVGSRIRELRGAVLQEELAVYLGISQGQLSKLERGRLGPTAEILVRLAERFGKSTDWILTGRG